MSFDQSSVHASSSVLPSQEGHLGQTMSYPRENNARNMRGGNGRCRAFTITQKELYQAYAKAFRAFAGNGPGAAKKIADVLECSNKTAQNYLDGRNAPGPIHDLRALNAIPHYEAMKRELAALERDIDPRLQAKLVEFARMVQQHGHTLFEGPEVTE